MTTITPHLTLHLSEAELNFMRSVYGEDQHLALPRSETLEAMFLLLRLMCICSNRRPQKYANEPWLRLPPTEHLEHAAAHADTAHYSLDESEDRLWLDDDGLPHAVHAALRIAFALHRKETEDERTREVREEIAAMELLQGESQ